jgi:glucosamine--fructose-6-phosphate aminotransferase (isomerizing)
VTSPTTAFEREIEEQPQVLARLFEKGRAEIDALAEAVRARAPRFVLAVARGSSDNAARYAQYLLGVRNELVVALAAPSVVTLYQARPRLAEALVLAISQSGESPDVVAVLAEARGQGALTAAIVNEAGSPLAAAAEHVVRLHAGEERAVAATKTYLAELGALAMLSASLAGSGAEELDALPERVEATLRAPAAIDASRFAAWDRLVVLGRGFHYATAFEVALKLKETSALLAEPLSTADFLHGPVTLLDQKLPALLVAAGSLAPETEPLLDRLSEVVAISDRDGILARATLPLRIPSVPDWLSPILAAVPGQRFAAALARARGLDPNAPRGLTKVTRTR